MPPTNALSNGEDLLVLQFGELFYTTYQAEENPLPRPAASSDPDFEVSNGWTQLFFYYLYTENKPRLIQHNLWRKVLKVYGSS